MCDRAEQILAELGAGELAAGSAILDAGLDARRAALADRSPPCCPPRAGRPDAPSRAPWPRCESIAGAAGDVLAAAEARSGWCAGSPPPSRRQPPWPSAWLARLRSWAWADRALAPITSPDTARTPAGGRRLRGAARGRYASAARNWTRRSPPGLPPGARRRVRTGDLLLVENVLERIARPAGRPDRTADHRGGRDERGGGVRRRRGHRGPADLGRGRAAASMAGKARWPSCRRPPRSPGQPAVREAAGGRAGGGEGRVRRILERPPRAAVP